MVLESVLHAECFFSGYVSYPNFPGKYFFTIQKNQKFLNVKSTRHFVASPPSWKVSWQSGKKIRVDNSQEKAETVKLETKTVKTLISVVLFRFRFLLGVIQSTDKPISTVGYENISWRKNVPVASLASRRFRTYLETFRSLKTHQPKKTLCYDYGCQRVIISCL